MHWQGCSLKAIALLSHETRTAPSHRSTHNHLIKTVPSYITGLSFIMYNVSLITTYHLMPISHHSLSLCLNHISLLLLLTCCGVALSTTEYYVRATDTDDCPVEYCPAINEISDFNELNNTIFTLLPGNHTLKRPLQVSNVENVVIKGLFDSDSVIIELEVTPDYISSHLLWAFIHIKNALSIKIANITMGFTKVGAIIVWLDTCIDVEIKLTKILGVPSEGAIGLWVTNSNNNAATNLAIGNMIFGIYCERTTGFSLKHFTLS